MKLLKKMPVLCGVLTSLTVAFVFYSFLSFTPNQLVLAGIPSPTPSSSPIILLSGTNTFQLMMPNGVSARPTITITIKAATDPSGSNFGVVTNKLFIDSASGNLFRVSYSPSNTFYYPMQIMATAYRGSPSQFLTSGQDMELKPTTNTIQIYMQDKR